MLNWNTCKPEEFSFEIDVEEIQEVGQRQIFPVRVFYKDGVLAFFKSITFRSEFYLQLRERKDWKEKLLVILKQRVKEEIEQRIGSKNITMDDRFEFLESGYNRIN